MHRRADTYTGYFDNILGKIFIYFLKYIHDQSYVNGSFVTPDTACNSLTFKYIRANVARVGSLANSKQMLFN